MDRSQALGATDTRNAYQLSGTMTHACNPLNSGELRSACTATS